MIRTQQEYEEAKRRYRKDGEAVEFQQIALQQQGLTPDEVKRAMEPLLTFRLQLDEEISWYENVIRQTIPPAKRLTDIGRLLIAVRISRGLSQRDLAKILGVSESQVSRDEHNDYHGITMERAQRIFDALGYDPVTNVEKKPTPDPVVQDTSGDCLEAVVCC